METNPEMTSTTLVELLQLFERAAIPVWLDGGWGVDALLQTQDKDPRELWPSRKQGHVRPARCFRIPLDRKERKSYRSSMIPNGASVLKLHKC